MTRLAAALTVLLLAAAQIACAADVYEPDNSTVTAKAIGFGAANQQIHSIEPGTEIDFVTFTLSAAADVIIQTDADVGAADTLLKLYDNTATQIASDDDGNPAGNHTSRLAASNLAAGVYYASVESFAVKRIRAYRLTVVTSSPGVPLAPAFTSKLTASGSIGAVFTYPISAIGSLPMVYTASGLPPGLSVAGSWITGVPTQAGSFNVTLTASNGTAPDASATLVITVVTGGVISTVAGDGKFSFSGDGGEALAAALNAPAGVAVDAAGNVYIADTANNRVRKVDAVTRIIQTVAGTGIAGFSGDGAAATSAQLDGPVGVAFDAAGNLYISDTANNRIRKRDTATGIIATIAGTGVAGATGDGGPAAAAQLSGPTAIVFDASGNLYVADTGNHRVRKIGTPPGMTIQTIAGNGTPAFAGDGGLATAASLNSPAGIAVDSSGNVYIADTVNNRVRKVDVATGFISTIVGVLIADPLSSPRGLLVDAAGLYIADSDNDRVRRLDFASGALGNFAGDGVNDFSGDGGPATQASLAGPTNVAQDAAGYVYIGDTLNSRIRKVGVAVAPAITSAATASGTKNAIFPAYRVTATGHPTPAISAANLPAGLSLAGGEITGVPAVSGAMDVTLTAQNSVGSSQFILRLLIAQPAGSVNTPPAFSSTPAQITASPNPAFIGGTVNFVVPSVADPEGDQLACTWTFGDANAPATAVGSVTAHAYSAPGIYTVTVTVTDGVNTISAATPVAINDPSVTQPMIISKSQLKLNFTKSNADSLSVSGQIPLRDKFTAPNKTVLFFFGNLTRTFALNEKGAVTSKTDVIKLTAKQKSGVYLDTAKQFYAGKYAVTLKSQTLSTSVAYLGFVKNVPNSTPITVPILISIDNDSYLQNVTFVYKASSTSGSGSKLKEGASLPSRGQ